MERYLSNPNVDKTVVNPLRVYEGGTSGTTVKEAQENLDILDKGAIGAPNGLAILPPGGLFGGVIEGGVSDTPMIDGPSFVRTNQTNRFFITNYDIETDYVISTTLGRVERDKDYLIFYSGPEVGVATIKVNNLEVKLDVLLAIINMPFILSPTSGTQDINSLVEIQTSMFVTGEVGTRHASTDWQLSTTVEMDNFVKYVEKDQTHLTNWKVEGLKENVTYYARFRYWDNVGNKSSWSEITQFTTRKTFTPQVPDIVAPSNGTKGLRADVNFTATNFFTYEDATHLRSDWQVSTSSVFAGLVDESQADEVNLTTWSIGGLSTDTLYYVRVRYTDNKGRTSDWSLPSRFTTRESFSADTPTIVSPANQSDNHNSSVTVTASYFANGDSRVTHQSSDWEVSEDNSFQYPFISSYSNSTAKVEWIAKGLQPNTTYFVRVRYRDTMGFVTDWSKAIQFTTRVSFSPARPTITSPANSTIDVGPWLDLRTSAYVSNNVGDSHLNSDWEIGTSLSFNDLVKWNTATIDDKITWTVKGLEEGSQYFVRIRHRSSIDGEEFVSDWSSPVSFSTKVSFAPGKPTITYPRSGAKDVSENINITSTNYLPSDSQDVHVNSDWEISTNSGFTDIVQSNYGSAVAKTLWQVTNMRSLTTFFVRVRHRTINDGIYYVSDWSSANNFTVEHTAPATPVILTPSNGSDKVDTNPLITSSAYLAGEVEEKHFASSWQIASDSQFTDIVLSLQSSSTNKVSWQVEGLENSKNYYVRVKHIGSLGFESAWSNGSQFTTKAAIVSQAPKILKPTEGAVNVDAEVSITSSSFATSEPSDSHLSSDWEISLESSFTSVIKSEYNSMVSKTSWVPGKLLNQTIYYVRVRHKGSLSGPTGWSTPSSFTTKAAAYNQAPSIVSPSNNATVVGTAIEITSSVFASSDTSDTHLSSDWQLSTSSTFATLANSVTGSLVNKTKWSPGGLQENTSYYVRVRHTGSITGPTGWSTASGFKTKAPDVIGQVAKPSIAAPSNGSTELNTSFTIAASAFSSSVAGDSHKASDWEVATDIGFSNVVKSSYDNTSGETTWTVGGLTGNTTYYLRVRYKGNIGGNSPWSDVVKFTTRGGGGGPIDEDETTSVSVVKNFGLNRDTLFTKQADMFYHTYPPKGQPFGPYDTPTAFITTYDTTATGIVRNGAHQALSETYLTVFNPTRVSLDKSKITYTATINLGSQTGLRIVSRLNYTDGRGEIDLVDPDGISSGLNVGGSIHGDENLTTVVRGINNYLYLFKERETDSGVKMSYIGKATAPPEYESSGVGNNLIVTDDGSHVMSYANGDVIYIFAINETSITFKYRLKLQNYSAQYYQCSSNGNTIVVTPATGTSTYVYDWNGTGWALTSTIECGTSDTLLESGHYVQRGNPCITADGNTITLVSPDGSFGSNLKPVYTFFKYKRKGSTWVQNYKFSVPIPDIGKVGSATMPSNDGTGYFFDYYHLYPYHYTARDGSKSVVNGMIYTVNDTGLYGDSIYILLHTKVPGQATETVNTPSIISPSSGASLSPDGASFTSSAFSSSASGSTHASSDWEIATNSAFTTIVKSAYASTSEKASWSVSGLTTGATLYVRVKHISSSGAESGWSNTVSFKTIVVQVPGSNGIYKYDLAPIFIGVYDPVQITPLFTKNPDVFSIFSTVYSSTGDYSSTTYNDIVKATVSSGNNYDYVSVKKTQHSNNSNGQLTGPVLGAWSTIDKSKHSYFGVETTWSGTWPYPVYKQPFITRVENTETSTGPGAGNFQEVPDSPLAYVPPAGKSVSSSQISSYYAVTVNNTFDTIAFSWNDNGTPKVKVRYAFKGDDNIPVAIETEPLAIPSGSSPFDWGSNVQISGNGAVVFVFSGGNWVYIYQRDDSGTNWIFAEKIQMPIAVNFADSDETGDTLIAAGVTNYATVVVTKKNGSWNNFKVVEPLGSKPVANHYTAATTNSISNDGKIVSVGVVNGKKQEVHFFRRQADDSWGSVKVVDMSIPDVGEFIDYKVYHKLSFDGTKCFIKEPDYKIVQGSNAISFQGKVWLAY